MNSIYTLEDLVKWDRRGTHLAVLGFPIKHSLSPVMQNAALAQMAKEDGQFAGWKYHKFEIRPDYLSDALKYFYKKNFLGLNLTSPHKVDAVSCIASIEEVARKMGAVNSLILEKKGYRGFNTDGYGFQAAVEKEFNCGLAGETVIVLGAGGAAKAVALQCLLNDVGDLWVGNRGAERLNELLRALGIMARGRIRTFDLAKVPNELPKTGILINATSLGMNLGDGSPIGLERFEPTLRVMDLIYNPRMTALLKAAKRAGMAHANGLSMLVEQGARSLEVFTQKKVPVDVMYSAVRDVLNYVESDDERTE